MSWNRSKTPPPPRAFMGSNESAVDAAVRQMAREQRHMATRHLTIEDLRQLFIPAQHRDALKHAFAVASPTFQDQELVVEIPMTDPAHHLDDKQKLVATFKWDHQDCPEGFYVPRDQKLVGLQPDVPEEIMEKWRYAYHDLARISWEFGLVACVLDRLNKNGYCNTPQQMRFVWPAIRHIVDKARIKGFDLVEASARAGDRARIPGEIREFLIPTVNIVNRTVLIDKIDTNEKRDFKLAVNTPTFVVSTPESMTGTVLFNGVN